MQLRPRHYVLLAVVIGLFVFNVVRSHNRKKAEQAALQQTNALAGPAWAAFDKAAGLKGCAGCGLPAGLYGAAERY